MGKPPGEVTVLLGELTEGRQEAWAKLIPLVYDELRLIAGHHMRGERTGHTLQATALVNEAYVRLVGQKRTDWRNRAHFFGVAAQSMRRVLVDHARARLAGKRGGSQKRVELEDVETGLAIGQSEEVLAIDKALQRLQELDPRQARIVEMRYFAGLSVEETAEALGTSPRTVKRDWAMAQAWLRGELSGRNTE